MSTVTAPLRPLWHHRLLPPWHSTVTAPLWHNRRYRYSMSVTQQTVQLQHPCDTTDSTVIAPLWHNRQYSYSTPVTQQLCVILNKLLLNLSCVWILWQDCTVITPLWHNRQWVQLMHPCETRDCRYSYSCPATQQMILPVGIVMMLWQCHCTSVVSRAVTAPPSAVS